jgi:serralysin
MKEEAMKRVSLMFVLVGVMVVLSAGVATAAVKYGSNGRDFFIGTNGEDTFYGKGGSDGLFGRGDDDVLYGNEGNDFIFGGSFRYEEIFDGRRMVPDGEDRLYGGSGDDCMFAGSEDDVIYGGTGNDEMGFYCYDFIFDTGEDVFYGGPGKDFIWSWDAASRKPDRDIVYCGSGRDEVLADKLDRLYGCERVERFGRR